MFAKSHSLFCGTFEHSGKQFLLGLFVHRECNIFINFEYGQTIMMFAKRRRFEL